MTFGDIRGLWIDSTGRVFVADALDHNVRVFDRGGALVATIGRSGAGPGEFNQPCCLGLGPDGNLWIKDFGNRRYTAFDVRRDSPAYVTSVRSGPNPVGYFDRVSWTAGRSILDVQTLLQPGGSRLRFARNRVGLDGTTTALDTIDGPDPKELREFVLRRDGGAAVFTQPFGPRALVAFGPEGRVAVANSASYSVRLMGDGGRLIRVLERELGSLPELSARESANASRTIETIVSRNGIGRGDLPFGIPDHKAALASLGFDQDGRLWVRRSVADGAENVADVYLGDGSLVAEVRWPANVRINLHAASGWTVVGIETQADDTANPVVLRLARAPR